MTLKQDVNLRYRGVDSYYRPIVDVNSITFGSGPAIDSFGRLRVSSAYTLFDSQQEYGLNTRTTWDATANGTLSTASSNGSVVSGSNAVGPTNANTRMTPITVSSTTGHYSVLQSRQYIRYIPGKSHLILLTGIFSPGTVANNVSRAGYFDSANGIFFEVTNGALAMVRRTSTSGSVVDNRVEQVDWNIDAMTGSGPSALILDATKTNILFIQAQWLGVGRVVVGFDINGVLHPVHEFLNANTLAVPYTQTFNLPVRLETRNTGASAGATIQFVCCSVQSEGGQESRGFPFAAPPTIISTAVTTRRPVMSIRPKATYNSRTNRAHIEDLLFSLIATTNNSMYEIVVGGTLTGAAWTSVGTTSAAEYDTTATAIANGVSISSGIAPSGSGVTAGIATRDADIRNPLVISQIDALTANQINVSIVCTSFTGTSDISALANWHEQTI